MYLQMQRLFCIAFSLLLIWSLSGCQPEQAASASSQSRIRLYADSTQLNSDGATPVNLYAILTDASGVVVEGKTLTFSVNNDGVLQSVSSTTDASGQATAQLSTAGNKANRVITVTATLDSVTSTLPVSVVGTTLTVTGNSSLSTSSTSTLTARLTDSAGDPIANQTVSITSTGSAVGIIGSTSPSTNANGQVTVTVSGVSAGSGSITFTALGATASQALTVTGASSTISFNSLTGNATTVGTTETMTVNGPASTVISLSASRGTVTPSTVTTNGSGTATFSYMSTAAGPATVSGSANSGSLMGSYSFTVNATTAASINLTANKSILATQEQVTLTATVRDSSGNVVPGKQVDFSVTDSIGGSIASPISSLTNSSGQASATYVAGNASSGTNGVTVSALVNGTAISASQLLTVVAGANNINLTMDNSLTADGLFYVKTFTAKATNTAGNPVAGQTIQFRVFPISYKKGGMTYNSTLSLWVQSGTITTCAAEDTDHSGSIDGGEVDVNGNNQPDPSPSESVTSSVTTDSNGEATVNLRYPKERASWLTVTIEAYNGSSGGQALASRTITLSTLLADAQNSDPPAFQTSPFGTATSCASPN